MELSEKQIRRLRKIAKVLDEGDIAVAELILDLEEKIEQEIPAITNLITRMKGEDGKTPTREELLDIIRPLIPQVRDGKDGKDGKDYILTNLDKKQIAKEIQIPVVEKVIEKTEVIRETPIITEITKEVENKDNGEQIITKINEDETSLIKKEKIEGLDETFKNNHDDLLNRAVSIVDSRTSFLINKVSNLSQKVDNINPVETQDLQAVTDLGSTTTNSIEAPSFVVTGGTPSEFLKADGSVDSNTYLTSISGQDLSLADNSTSQFITLADVDLSGYVPYTGANANVDLGMNRLSLNGVLAGSIYRALAVNTATTGSGRSIPLAVTYDDPSTNLTGDISGMNFSNESTTNNSYSGLMFSTRDTGGTALVNAFIHGVHTSHAVNNMSTDISVGLRHLGSLSERARFSSNGNFQTQSTLNAYTSVIVENLTSGNVTRAGFRAQGNGPRAMEWGVGSFQNSSAAFASNNFSNGSYIRAEGILMMGTITNHAVRLFSNNTQRGTITEAGRFGWGDTAPEVLFKVQGTTSAPVTSDNVVAKFRNNVTSTGGAPTAVVSIARQNSDITAWFLGTDNNNHARLLVNGNLDIVLGKSVSGTITNFATFSSAGTLDVASGYSVGGTAGFTGTGAYTNFTIVGGIITNAS
jgi:hypothetical protein